MRKDTIAKPVEQQEDIPENVLKSEMVKWRKLKWLQPGDPKKKKKGDKSLKYMTNENRDRLLTSLKKHGKIKSFHVWHDQEKDSTYILDGHHLKAVLEYFEQQGGKLLDEYRADFIRCQDINCARELVLVYSAVYTTIDPEGLYQFAHEAGWDIDDFSKFEEEINFDNIGLGGFVDGWFGDGPNLNPGISNKMVTDEEIEKKAKELAEKMVSDQNSEPAMCPKCGHEFNVKMSGEFA